MKPQAKSFALLALAAVSSCMFQLLQTPSLAQQQKANVETLSVTGMVQQYGGGLLCNVSVNGANLQAVITQLPPRTTQYLQRKQQIERSIAVGENQRARATAQANAAVAATEYSYISGDAAWVENRSAQYGQAKANKATVDVMSAKFEGDKAGGQDYIRTNAHLATVYAVKLPARYGSVPVYQCLPNYVPPSGSPNNRGRQESTAPKN